MAAGLAACVAVVLALYLWIGRIRRPPAPAAARLPSSARAMLQPTRRDSLDVAVPAQGERSYEVGMQAGATLVYAWSTGRRGETVACQFAGRESQAVSEVHSAFVAQSAGWYRWRWKNPSGRSVTIHLKLSGYYEPVPLPPLDVR